MSNIFASFITPVRVEAIKPHEVGYKTKHRLHKLERCIKSIGGYTSKSKAYEHVIIDDNSTEKKVFKLYRKWKKEWPYNIQIKPFKDHLERIYAFNAGMLSAQGEWIIHLDSDDVMKPNFKEEFEKMVKEHQDANLFVWKGDIVWQDGKVTERSLFRPAMKDNGQCEIFKSGVVFSGGFAFKKSCLNVTGYLPQPRLEEATSPYAFGRIFLNTYDELKPLYTMLDGHLKTDIGNPWGQDFAMVYMLTRHWMPYSINKSLHTTYVRP